MLFNSLTFVAFFCIVYSLYLLLQHRPQNLLLLVASYVFYGWWDWRFLSLVFISTVVDYACAHIIYRADRPGTKRLLISISVILNLGFLGFFKYFNFFADSAARVLTTLGLEPDPVTLNIVLPVGISFYTFQTMSYTIDVYRGTMKPAKSLLDFALYVSFFPQLVAGPIERADRLLPQIEQPRSLKYENLREGSWLILVGYFKKVVIADNFAYIADEVFNNPGEYQGLAVLLGIYAFAFQIYGDFAGYSSIAQGVAKVFGFDLMMNFRRPYFSQNPQEFWRRWHISLSTWLRDYLYIPLGGGRHGTANMYRNLFLTMLLGGLWHGAAWNFVVWGAYQGLLLIAHRVLTGKLRESRTKKVVALALKIAVMFQFTCLGWVFFRVNSMADFPVLMANLFTPGPVPQYWLTAFVTLVTPLLLLNFFEERADSQVFVKRYWAPARLGIYAGLFAYILVTGRTSGATFIYFQF